LETRFQGWKRMPEFARKRPFLYVAGGILFAAAAFVATRRRPKPRHWNQPPPELPVFAENRLDVLYAWRGPAMMVLDPHGAAGTVANSGLFFRQTRYLRDLRLELFGEPAYACSAAETAPNELEFMYVYPEKPGGGSDKGGERNGVRFQDLDLRVTYRVAPNGVEADLRIFNRWMEQATIDLAWLLSADFADYDEVFGERKQNAEIASTPLPSGVRFRYLHPQLPLETVVRVEGPGEWHYTDGRLAGKIQIARQAEVRVNLVARAIDCEDPISDEQAHRRERRLGSWRRSIATVDAPGDAPIATLTNRSLAETGSLALLEGPEEEWLVPSAGIPLYQSLWFRDALTTAWHASAFDRGAIAEAILSACSRLQGESENVWRDEQPGRIPRGAQRSPLARLNVSPMGLYYGDYAGPFAFLFALGQLYA
jgi:hypothetical protein